MRDAYRPFVAQRPQNLELAFTTSNVEEAYAKAIAAGARSVLAPERKPWGQTVAYVASLEGTIFGFLTPPSGK
jgi:lactoylglutathione lyase